MRFYTVGLLSVALVGVVTSISVDDCPGNLPRNNYLQTFDNKCYYFFVFMTREFDEAQAKCKASGGDLTSVKSDDVNSFLWGTLRTTFKIENDVWIGLSDQEEEGKYVWRDGSKMVWENFASGTGPKTSFFDISNKVQDCVAIDWEKDGKWKDIKCNGKLFNNDKHFVCEYDPKPATPKSSTLRSTTPTTTTATTITTTTPVPQTTTTTSTTSAPPTTTSTPSTRASTSTTQPRPTTTTTTTTPPPPTTTTTTTSTPSTTASTTTTTTQPPPTSTTTTTAATTTTSSTQKQSPQKTNPETTEYGFSKETSTPEPTCPSIVCNIDCGLSGYVQNSTNGCMECRCNEEDQDY